MPNGILTPNAANRFGKPAASRIKIFGRSVVKNRQLLILLIPGILHYIIFRYVPLTGIIIAFKDFDVYAGISGSAWAGLKHFENLFGSSDIWKLTVNTVLLGSYSLLWGMPIPILFALLLNEMKNKRLKKLVQSVSFFPSLLSVVVVCSMVTDFLSPSNGIVNSLIAMLGLKKHYFMIDPSWFRTIYVSSEVWQKFGYNAIIYFSAISAIDSQLYEAADIDGCGRFKKILHITLPSLLPTICVMVILNAGNAFKIGADKVLLLYNPMTYTTADVFGTFVYRKGILESNFSYSAAAGLFESLVAFVFVLAANKLSKRFAENSLW